MGLSKKLTWVNGLAPFLSKQIQSHDVFDFLLDECGRADKMDISSFAITESYVRRIIRNRDRIGHLTLFLDFTIASRSPRMTMYAAKNVDELYLTNNHSKTIYITGQGREYLAVMSNNATNNHRYESGLVCSSPEVICHFLEQYRQMKNDSVKWDG
jgi:hypothetical protein